MKEKECNLAERILANPLDCDKAFNKRVQNCHLVSKGHINATDCILDRMWFVIGSHRSLASLADLIDNPEQPNTQEHCLFVYLCSVKTPCKLAILNNVILVLAQVLVKKKVH